VSPGSPAPGIEYFHLGTETGTAQKCPSAENCINSLDLSCYPCYPNASLWTPRCTKEMDHPSHKKLGALGRDPRTLENPLGKIMERKQS